MVRTLPRWRCSLVLAFCLLAAGTGSAAAALVASDDSFSVPASTYVLVEPAGVIGNDSLDGNNAVDGGVTVTLVSSVTDGTLVCPTNGALELCPDGSFEYTAGSTFNGYDTFVYRARSPAGATATATVTLTACSQGGVITCWQEAPYVAKLAELGYNAFLESFEGSPWNSVRSTFLTVVSAPSITSKGITWTSNFPATNNITTGPGPARSGLWGAYDPDHGHGTGTPTNCDVNTLPDSCRPFDGLTGSGTALFAVGGYFSGIIASSNIAVVLDGAVPLTLGKLAGGGHHFYGLIDSNGFSQFQFREVDGKVGQELPIFVDDVIIGTTSPVPPNAAPVLAPIGDQALDEDTLLRIDLSATDANDGDLLRVTADILPAGSRLRDNEDGTATFTWTPGFDQSGVYPLTFRVTDNGIPSLEASESIAITVNDVNRAPTLDPIGDQTTDDGQLLSFLLSASDPDGHNLSFAMSGAPAGAGLTDNGDGTAVFDWTPSFSQVGDHLVNFIVTDGGLPAASASELITISVTTPDVTPPVITLLGSNPVSLELGNGYIEAGATAFDNIDGDITPNLVMTSTVNLNAVGSYTVTYNVSDTAGNAATPAVRTVNVTPDVTAPSVSAPASITVAAVDASGTAASATAIANFLNAATANDAVDGALPVTNNAPTRFPLGPTTVTFSAIDSSSNRVVRRRR
jgi:hypothetical protein